jgi:hypothetical protein
MNVNKTMVRRNMNVNQTMIRMFPMVFYLNRKDGNEPIRTNPREINHPKFVLRMVDPRFQP